MISHFVFSFFTGIGFCSKGFGPILSNIGHKPFDLCWSTVCAILTLIERFRSGWMKFYKPTMDKNSTFLGRVFAILSRSLGEHVIFYDMWRCSCGCSCSATSIARKKNSDNSRLVNNSVRFKSCNLMWYTYNLYFFSYNIYWRVKFWTFLENKTICKPQRNNSWFCYNTSKKIMMISE